MFKVLQINAQIVLPGGMCAYPGPDDLIDPWVYKNITRNVADGKPLIAFQVFPWRVGRNNITDKELSVIFADRKLRPAHPLRMLGAIRNDPRLASKCFGTHWKKGRQWCFAGAYRKKGCVLVSIGPSYTPWVIPGWWFVGTEL